MQTLQAHDFTVEDKTSTGDTSVVREALRQEGDRRVSRVHRHGGPRPSTAKSPSTPSVLQSATLLYEDAKKKDADVGMTWLWQAPASSALGIAVPKKLATAKKLVTLEDLAKYVKAGGVAEGGRLAEFFTKSNRALAAFERVYGFKLTAGQKLELDSDDTALAETAAAQGTRVPTPPWRVVRTATLSCAWAWSSLTDPRGRSLPYQPAPVFRTEVYEKYRRSEGLAEPRVRTARLWRRCSPSTGRSSSRTRTPRSSRRRGSCPWGS